MLISKINLPVCGQCGGNLSFGYKSIIKTLWLQGELPEVTKGLYGLPLSKETITNEHLEPHCVSKDNTLANLALADKTLNNLRGNKPLKDFLTLEQAKSYYAQFIGIKLKDFDGDLYIKEGMETIKKLGVK